MPLSVGTRLGLYEIAAPIGTGGMGEVYRARDTKLGRDVAVKVLPSLFASDSERIARFEREAKALAALNHPHIATLHGMEEAGGQHVLVMELVEGETLAERLQRGPLPVEDALTIAHQIAEALDAAHEKGIVHRDLKPANVKITPDEKVKVLDFGLAKAMETESPDGTELFYTPGPGNLLLAVSISTRPSFTFGEGSAIARPFLNAPPAMERTYDVARDGRRFLGLAESLQTNAGTVSAPRFHVVLNWFEELKARVPVGR